MKNLLRRLISRRAPRVRQAHQDKNDGNPEKFSREEMSIVSSVSAFTMTSPLRIVHLMHSVEYISENRLPGAVVECGVWRGGSMMVVANTLIRIKSADRRLFLYDTFDGMTPPDEIDKRHDGVSAVQLLEEHPKTQTDVNWAYATFEDVEANIQSTDYPRELVHFVKGKVEDTVPKSAPDKIALLRLDTDWYASTAHELKHLYPRVVSGGVIIIDDYGWWQGARRAVDEYFNCLPFKPLLNRVDETARSFVKP